MFLLTLPSIFHISRTTCLLNIIEKVTKFDEFELTCRKERDCWKEGLIANEAVRFLFLNILFHLKYICNVLRGEVRISWGGRGECYLVAVSEQYQKIIFDKRRNISIKYINLSFSSPVSHIFVNFMDREWKLFHISGNSPLSLYNLVFHPNRSTGLLPGDSLPHKRVWSISPELSLNFLLDFRLTLSGFFADFFSKPSYLHRWVQQHKNYAFAHKSIGSKTRILILEIPV